jgi:pimeloyl-ACP methyl ester carboxylesterase
MSHDQDPMIWTHGMADIESGLRLRYVTAGIGPRVVVLLHGFPQTWRQWHRVIPPLVDAGFRVVAPDSRGAGDSWRPPGGYDKRTMANDIRQLLRQQHLGATRRSDDARRRRDRDRRARAADRPLDR